MREKHRRQLTHSMGSYVDSDIRLREEKIDLILEIAVLRAREALE